MSNGSQIFYAAVPFPAQRRLSGVRESGPGLRHNEDMPDGLIDAGSMRLRKHADYQHVYKASRKHFSQSMSYFFRRRTADDVAATGEVFAPRVGLTAGRVLGKAVERNRIKRRMREVVRLNLGKLPESVDVVLHPRKFVIDMEFAKLQKEVARIFSTIAAQINETSAGPKQ